MRKRIPWIIAAVVAATLAALIWRLDIPHWQRLDLARLTEQPASTQIFDASGASAGTLQGGVNRQWIALDSVPPLVQSAFIAAEDARFYRHHGVDVYRMFGALWQDIRSMSYAQGASTITQQLIKLTHLTSVKSLSRKAQEIVLALQLERRMDKRRILEAYLNTVYFGHGAYGIEAAANVYFGKSADALTLAEGALLAGVIKSPSNYAPHLNAEKALARRDRVLSEMADQGFITDEARDAAKSEPLRLADEIQPTRQYAWVMDAVLREAQTALGLSAEEVLSGGYRIETGFDPALQAIAEALFRDPERFPADAADGTPAQAALIALDDASGEIRAVVGGRGYEVRRGLNRALQSRRQPGSAFKPVSTYAAAIDAFGYVPASIIDDTPRAFAGGYTPRNAGGNSYGPVTLREALSRSLNIATVDLAQTIGVEALRNYAGRFGIALSPRDANLSLALGALTDGVSPAGLGAAYCALANGGTRVNAHLIRAIYAPDGSRVYEAPSDHPRAVSAETAYMVTDMLVTAAHSGSASALAACGLPVAGKTGTVSESAGGTRDIWTVAYTPELAVCAWMGFDAPDADHALPASAGGSGFPARLCAAFLQSSAPRLSGRGFARPAGVRMALLDALALSEDHTALLSTERTPRRYIATELFHDDDMPDRFSDNWIAPLPVEDFRLLTGSGETPVLAFTARQSGAEYLLLRTTRAGTEQLAALSGEPGREIRFVDDTHDLSQTAGYTLLPRNARLNENGVLLTGPETPPVQYTPGGWLNAIMGVGAEDSAPTPTEIDDSEVNQSLFG